MSDAVRFARHLERAIAAAIAEDRCAQVDLPGMIDDLETTYAEIIARLRRAQASCRARIVVANMIEAKTAGAERRRVEEDVCV